MLSLRSPASVSVGSLRRLVPGRASVRLDDVTPRAVAVACAVLAGGICLVWFALPGNVLGMGSFDSGVYFAVSLRLVEGVVPYRDFVFVQPPGIALLMAPLALLAKVVGAPAMFVASRLLNAGAAAGAAGLAALTVRHRGRLAMAVAGMGTAVFPYAATVDHSLNLEPFLVLFVLAAIVVARPGAGAPTAGRLAASGALMGIAGAVKIWAVFPFVALVACEALRSRRRAGWMVAGTAASFGLVCLPFLVMAPGAMIRQVVLDQLGRGGYDYTAISMPDRLGYLSGLDALVGHAGTLGGLVGSVATAALALAVLAAIRAHRRGRGVWTLADGTAAACAAASVAGLLAAPGMYVSYTYFTAPFLAGAVAVLVAEHRRRRAARPGPVVARGGLSPVMRWAGAGAGAGLLAWLVVISIVSVNPALGGGRLAANGTVLAEAPAVARVIPAGTCVVSDDPAFLVQANRYQAARPGCPTFIDPFGTWMVADHGGGAVGKPPFPPAVVAMWHQAFAHAGALVLSNLDQLMIPWTPGLRAQLAGHFRVVLTEPDASVYVRR